MMLPFSWMTRRMGLAVSTSAVEHCNFLIHRVSVAVVVHINVWLTCFVISVSGHVNSQALTSTLWSNTVSCCFMLADEIISGPPVCGMALQQGNAIIMMGWCCPIIIILCRAAKSFSVFHVIHGRPWQVLATLRSWQHFDHGNTSDVIHSRCWQDLFWSRKHCSGLCTDSVMHVGVLRTDAWLWS